MWKIISDNLIKVLQEFGVIGVLTYVAGMISLWNLFSQDELNQRILFGVIGLVMFIISSSIAYFRMKLHKERDEYLIKKVMESNSKLAERINNNFTNEQVVSITQTIWQSQKDLIESILDVDLDEVRNKKK